MRKEIHTFCGVCANSCALIAVVEGNKLISVRPDNQSKYRHDICPAAKGPLTSIGIENSPDRLKYPLKRVGQRGEGKWERISWGEALDAVAQKLLYLKEKFGPESLVICLGEPKNVETAFFHRFATVFGTPNVVTPGSLCGEPHLAAAAYTYGRAAIPDEPEEYTENTPLPRVFVDWGRDTLNHHTGRHRMKTYTEHGTKIVVVDPMQTTTAKTADLWVRLRPGSDGALIMGILKVIIEDKLYDKDFVSRWTVGFNKLRDEVKTFTLDEVEQLTWVPKSQIVELARIYATNKPAAIDGGNAIDCQTIALKFHRAVCIMRAITGNLNIPGGDVFIKPHPHTRPGRFMLLSKIPRDMKKAVANDYPLAMRGVYTPYQCLVRANLEDKPYQIKASICCLTNPLLSFPDSEATYQAFMKMDFIVVLELFMTPMAALADIVLPAAWTWEDDTIGYWYSANEEIRAYPKVVNPPGEAWTDAKIVNELAKRMGFQEYFWEDEKDALEHFLEESGYSFRDLLKKGKLLPSKEYRKPEEEPFRTPSGKVEIYSQRLEEQNYDPIPKWKSLSPVSGELSEEYPLLVTNAKSNTYMLTGFKMLENLRRIEPDPIVWLNPETARHLGLKDGDWVYIETKKGRITQKLSLDPELDPRVVIAHWGWWYPEEGPETMYGWRKSNYNILTGYEEMGEECASPALRGLPCRVYQA